ncbi:hypothetical protein [Xylella fastidiosa]|uniref:hypothetical protein n=1 Tax=Xylella fastidiosa TaxID=2371 RepID=UPI003AFAEDFF
MNKFKAMINAFYSSIESSFESAFLEERITRLRMKISFLIISIFVFLVILFTEIDVSSSGVGGLVILGSIYSAVLFFINHYVSVLIDGSLKKKDASGKVIDF